MELIVFILTYFFEHAIHILSFYMSVTQILKKYFCTHDVKPLVPLASFVSAV